MIGFIKSDDGKFAGDSQPLGRLSLVVHSSLRQAGLVRLMPEGLGSARVTIALLDGLINCQHPSFATAHIEQDITGTTYAWGNRDHATFIASMLVGDDPEVLGICRHCKLLSIPIQDRAFQAGHLSATVAAERIAAGIRQAVSHNVDVIQLSLEFVPHHDFTLIFESIGWAAVRGIRIVIAAGNHPTLGSNPVLSLPGVVPVAMADQHGLPHPRSALGLAIGSRGLLAPGVDLPGAVGSNAYGRRSGSSYAASFVTGTFALLRSRFPHLDVNRIWTALLRQHFAPQFSIVPPPLDSDLCLTKLEQFQRSIK